MDSSSNGLSILLEANLRFLSANLQLNSLTLNTLNNPDALDENQNILNNLLNWLKSLSQVSGLNQNEILLIDSLKESVRKAKSFDILINKTNFSLIDNQIMDNKNQNKTQINLSTSDVEKIDTTNVTEEINADQTDNTIITEQENLDKKDNEEKPEIPIAFIYREIQENDRWDYLTSIQTFITSYEHLMHLLIPNLALEVVKELHHFDSQNKMVINEAIAYPSLLFQNMITKFLREAPGSNLFRRIRRIKLDNDVDINIEQAVNIGEKQNIKIIVNNYFNTLTEYLDPNSTKQQSLGILEDKTKNNLKQFSLGPASVEMRLTAVIKHVTDSALSDAEQAIQNENASLKTKIIYLATTQLMCDYQNFLLNEPRIIKFLEELKS